MKFLIDAQLPKSLKLLFEEKGYDVIHTLDLPEKNNTTDKKITEISLNEKRIVISKDADFYNRYLQKLEPYKLLYLTTGNMSNAELKSVLDNNFDRLIEAIATSNLVEMTNNSLIVID